MAMMTVAAASFAWLATQHIGWLDPFSNVASAVLAILFAGGAAMVASAENRKLGARIGVVAGLLALAPLIFLAVVLLAFDANLSDGGGIVPSAALAMAALVYVAFNVARRPTR